MWPCGSVHESLIAPASSCRVAVAWKAYERDSGADEKWPIAMRVWFILGANLAVWAVIVAAILVLIP